MMAIQIMPESTLPGGLTRTCTVSVMQGLLYLS